MRKVKLELAPFIILGHAQFCCTGCPNMFRIKENLKFARFIFQKIRQIEERPAKVHDFFRILRLDKIFGT